MNYRVWYSTESLADFIIDKTILRTKTVSKKKMYESDANNPRNFHTLPDHIKQILYLDAPDIIVELDSEPIFSIEVSTEAGTGHNAFQRFARLAASVENEVPAIYVYPEAVIILRQGVPPRWDSINPLVFRALEEVMNIYNIPALLYYFPSDYRNHSNPAASPNFRNGGLVFDSDRNYAGCPDSNHSEMQHLFKAIDQIILINEKFTVINGRNKLLGMKVISERRRYMNAEFVSKGGNDDMSPLTATVKVPTEFLLNHLSEYETAKYSIGELLRSRAETIIYKVNAKFRGDPYPGALAAIDYLLCREGKSFEERRYNLVLAWGNMVVDEENKTLCLTSDKSTVSDFINAVKASESKNLLYKNYTDIPNYEIPRYFMQVRYGSMFSKVKHVRVFSYFSDAILFPDGALWRDA